MRMEGRMQESVMAWKTAKRGHTSQREREAGKQSLGWQWSVLGLEENRSWGPSTAGGAAASLLVWL